MSPIRPPSGAPPRPGPESAVSRAPSRPRGQKPRGRSRVAIGEPRAAAWRSRVWRVSHVTCRRCTRPSPTPGPHAASRGLTRRVLLPGCPLSLGAALDSQGSWPPVPAGAVAVRHRRGHRHSPGTPTAPGCPRQRGRALPRRLLTATWEPTCPGTNSATADTRKRRIRETLASTTAPASRPPRAVSEGGRGLCSLPRGVAGLKTEPSGSQGRLAQGSAGRRPPTPPSVSHEPGQARVSVLPTRGALPARAKLDANAWPGRVPDAEAGAAATAGLSCTRAGAAEAPRAGRLSPAPAPPVTGTREEEAAPRSAQSLCCGVLRAAGGRRARGWFG